VIIIPIENLFITIYQGKCVQNIHILGNQIEELRNKKNVLQNISNTDNILFVKLIIIASPTIYIV